MVHFPGNEPRGLKGSLLYMKNILFKPKVLSVKNGASQNTDLLPLFGSY